MLPAMPTMAGGVSNEVAEIDQQFRELEKKAEEQGAVSQIRALQEMKVEAAPAPAPAPVIMSRKKARTEETGESGGSQQGGGITSANIFRLAFIKFMKTLVYSLPINV